jgi:hypothetical protein
VKQVKHENNHKKNIMEYRFRLDPIQKKHKCPNCEEKRFVRYIDTEENNNYLSDEVGMCDRKESCKYHKSPKDYFQETKISPTKVNFSHSIPKPKVEPIYYPDSVCEETLKPDAYDYNIFIQNLLKNIPFPFEEEEVIKVIKQYRLGTYQSGYMKGAVTFPFIDKLKNVRTIQVKSFDSQNHTTATNFVHSIIEKEYLAKNQDLPNWLENYKKNELKVSCLFGSHLLDKYPYHKIGLVEAPKTAVYSTLYYGFPDDDFNNLLWLAVYNLSSLTLEKCKALEGREVFLFPDLSKDGSTFANWSNKANDFNNQMTGTRFEVVDILEKIAPKELREDGADIADMLIMKDWRTFRKVNIKEQLQPIPEPPAPPQLPAPPPPPAVTVEIKQPITVNVNELYDPNTKILDWSKEVEELEAYFKSVTLPKVSISISQGEMILNVERFLESHFATLKRMNGKKHFLPYLHRLQVLKNYLAT